ncbi:HdeD family acid-resistance protein [Corynebacterium variabile]|uniref:HdeD family acid-resistance protein n=1 Tax=Corynebacterium variabile TaxID=1727 RepID=UPI003CA219EE
MSTSPQSPADNPAAGLLASLRKRGVSFLLWRGILAVLVGILLLISPFGSATVFGIIVGAWMMVDGLSTVGLSFRLKQQNTSWGWVLTDGVIQTLFGLLVILFPVTFAIISAFFVLGFMAIGMVLSGIVQLAAPVENRSGWTIAVGIINILFGVLLGALAIFNPVDNVVTLSWLAGIAALALGISLIVFSVKLRNLDK